MEIRIVYSPIYLSPRFGRSLSISETFQKICYRHDAVVSFNRFLSIS